MSNIGVALALCVLLLGAALVVGNGIATQAVDRGGDIGSALSNTNLGVSESTGTITITTP